MCVSFGDGLSSMVFASTAARVVIFNFQLLVLFWQSFVQRYNED